MGASKTRVLRGLAVVLVPFLLQVQAAAVARRAFPDTDGGAIAAAELAGRVVAIADGDTLTVLTEGKR